MPVARLNRRKRFGVLAALSLLAACSQDEAEESSSSRRRHSEADASSSEPEPAAPADRMRDPKPDAPTPPMDSPAPKPDEGGAGGKADEPKMMGGAAGSAPAPAGAAAAGGTGGTGGGGLHPHGSGHAGSGAAGNTVHVDPEEDAGVGPDPEDDAGTGESGAGGHAGSLAAGTGAGGVGGAGAGGNAAGSSGAAGGPPTPTGDHCFDGEAPSSADATLASEPDHWLAADGDIDLILPQGVLDWMSARDWLRSHDAWHNIRRCSSGTTVPRASVEICQHTELVPASQQCSGPDDGYQFLVMHRHMIRALKQAFPQHAYLFDGFARFPLEAADVPEEWRDRFGTGWSQAIRDTATVLEDIENRLDQFPTEGSLGEYIQCGATSRLSNIHGAMHFKWAVTGSPHSLGRQSVNLSNYMFWKLHGWIDNIWERYRVAKGLPPDEPALKAALADQCHGMHAYSEALAEEPPEPPSTDPLPTESGLFHETVRPIFEEICSSCHSETSPEAGMSLGGAISSTDVVSNLVNVPASHGGQYVRIAPGLPEQSWLYLKVSGLAAEAGCMGAECNPQTMPPTGQVTLTQAQLDAIRAWIAQGAPAPVVAP